MQRNTFFSFLALVLLLLGLAACSKGGANGDNNGAPGSGSSQLSWDQGNWNQTNWQ